MMRTSRDQTVLSEVNKSIMSFSPMKLKHSIGPERAFHIFKYACTQFLYSQMYIKIILYYGCATALAQLKARPAFCG